MMTVVGVNNTKSPLQYNGLSTKAISLDYLRSLNPIMSVFDSKPESELFTSIVKKWTGILYLPGLHYWTEFSVKFWKEMLISNAQEKAEALKITARTPQWTKFVNGGIIWRCCLHFFSHTIFNISF